MISTIVSIIIGFFAYKFLAEAGIMGSIFTGLIIGLIAKRIFRAFFSAVIVFIAGSLSFHGITGALTVVKSATIPLSLSLLIIGTVCGVLIRKVI